MNNVEVSESPPYWICPVNLIVQLIRHSFSPLARSMKFRVLEF